MSDKTRAAFEAWATGQGVSLKRISERENATYTNYDTYLAYQAWQASAAAQDARVRQMEEALRRLLIGCEHKTLYGVTGWHQKTMPSDMALDMARAALKEPS